MTLRTTVSRVNHINCGRFFFFSDDNIIRKYILNKTVRQKTLEVYLNKKIKSVIGTRNPY